MLDARTWLLWACTVLVIASAARNPLYALVVLGSTQVVYLMYAPLGASQRPAASARWILSVLILTALFNVLSVHLGDTVLFHLPHWLPWIGGAITAEALVFGLLNGLVLSAILSAFMVFNQVVPVRDLVRVTPRAFHEVGVVLSIALTFIPQTLSSLQRIREAQAVRGHRSRSLRDWLPIVVPLFISGLERSMTLAEAMVARGYGAVSDRPHSWRLQLLVVLGLFLLVIGWGLWLFVPASKALPVPWRTLLLSLALVGMIGGAACICGALWLAGRRVQYTAYRPRRWNYADLWVAGGCALTWVVTFLPLPGVNRTSLAYNPYPRLSWPVFDPFIGVGLLGLLMPVFARRVRG